MSSQSDSQAEAYYDEAYYQWQEGQGKFAGNVNYLHFQPFIKPTDRVIDFGCGGGFILNNIRCGEKMGVEINDTARKRANEHGFPVVKTIAELPDAWADVLMSNSVLEHVTNPYEALKELHAKLKPGGRVVFMIPHEVAYSYFPKDVNQHLYTWSPMCAGNLFTAAGYQVQSVRSVHFAWPPGYRKVESVLNSLAGKTAFFRFCFFYGRFVYPWFNPLYMRLRYGYPVSIRYVKVLAMK
jgi:SAM-dependent methyltransferase